jgi:cobaltochelatase CobT
MRGSRAQSEIYRVALDPRSGAGVTEKNMTLPAKERSLKTSVAATTRALARKPVRVEFGGRGGADIILPPLESDAPQNEVDYVRGEADRAAFITRFHNAELHQSLRPKENATLFDVLEAVRVEALGGQDMEGVRYNLARRFAYSSPRRGEVGKGAFTANNQPFYQDGPHPNPPPAGEGISFAGMLELFARRHIQQLAMPDFGSLLDTPDKDFKKALPLFSEMRAELADQKAFAKLSLKLLKTLSQPAQVEDTGNTKADTAKDTLPDKPQEPEQQEQMQAQSGEREEAEPPSVLAVRPASGHMQPQEGDKGEAAKSPYPFNAQRDEPLGPYHPYMTRFDETVMANALATPAELDFLRRQLDSKLEQFRGLTSKLAGKLQRLLMARQRRKWVFDQDDGLLDSKKLARLILHPSEEHIYKREEEADFRDTVVTLLIDNSGSMRGRPITMAAMCADILSRTLERCGVKSEILGFTTKEWKGGQTYKHWLKDGRPANPGRLNDIRHIIYKQADAGWRNSRKNLGLMLKEGILKENIDGEAIEWAVSRLMKRPEQRRILMVISDGAPVDDSTLSSNGGGYLDKHLREVIASVENQTFSRSSAAHGWPVELLAIGIGHDVTRYYQRAVTISDIDKLAETMTAQLAELFGSKK